MNRRGMSFWDALAWIALGIIIIWLILKTAGIINSPLWLEYVPIYTAVYIAGWAMHKLDTTVNDMGELKKFAKETVNEINNIKLNCSKNHSKK